MTFRGSCRPTKTVALLLSKWRQNLRLCHSDCGLQNGAKLLLNLGECVNACAEWIDLIEMLNKLITVNAENNTFTRKASKR